MLDRHQDYPVGTKFQLNDEELKDGKTYQVVDGMTCTPCAFKPFIDNCWRVPRCCSIERQDGIEVHFIETTPNETTREF